MCEMQKLFMPRLLHSNYFEVPPALGAPPEPPAAGAPPVDAPPVVAPPALGAPPPVAPPLGAPPVVGAAVPDLGAPPPVLPPAVCAKVKEVPVTKNTATKEARSFDVFI